uniref:Uncharacterized protein n=1 Tax=Cucumis melo TaxID=3656 RepID=A0A9I9EEH0_CUCME
DGCTRKRSTAAASTQYIRRLPLHENAFDGGTIRRQQLRRRPPPRAIHPVNRAATTAASLPTTT